MVMNYLEASKGAQKLTSDEQKGVKSVNDFVKKLGEQNRLPKKFSFGSQEESFLSSEPLLLSPFTSKEKKVLKEDGFLIYPFTLQTIDTQIEAGMPFNDGVRVTYKKNKENSVLSMVGEVAFNPDPERFFIPNSNSKSLEGQEEMIEEYGVSLQEKLGLPAYIHAVIGNVSDYTQLVFTYLEKTGERLFGSKYGYDYARTKTLVKKDFSQPHVFDVGNFLLAGDGLHITYEEERDGRNNLFAVPLIVSVKIK